MAASTPAERLVVAAVQIAPVWLERTDLARVESPLRKELHAQDLDQAVQSEAGHLDPIREARESSRSPGCSA